MQKSHRSEWNNHGALLVVGNTTAISNDITQEVSMAIVGSGSYIYSGSEVSGTFSMQNELSVYRIRENLIVLVNLNSSLTLYVGIVKWFIIGNLIGKLKYKGK